MKITFISDTHLKHNQITSSLPGGDLILHAGDLTSMGYKHEIQQFCKWYKELKGYNFKVFVAGNHDMGFEDDPEMTKEILDFYNELIYLQDSGFGIYDMDRDRQSTSGEVLGSLSFITGVSIFLETVRT